MMNRHFWNGKKVFITGHTGFKGAWLSLWLTMLGAKVTGYALTPPTSPSLFETAKIDQLIDSHKGNLNDLKHLQQVLTAANPDIVFHMAAQPIVGESYRDPVGTFQTNVMGTVNLLEAIRILDRQGAKIRAVVNVTTDKCYENKEWNWGYRENEPLGGNDPYSASKACSEIVTAAYRKSFFGQESLERVAIASARAGNVIGGGDWSEERLIPQCLEALIEKKPMILRKPQAIRPWQHVLEPLSGYLRLAEKLYEEDTQFYSEAWNFGPDLEDCVEVGSVVNRLYTKWGEKPNLKHYQTSMYKESTMLMLDCSKSKRLLDWKPIWNLDQALEKIVVWMKDYQNNAPMRDVTIKQINDYMDDFDKRKSSNESV
ncbi:CDP-glucose 4,6-dehydratase [Bacillus suaedae]|uniref:CDP-glucose 4,6-dehydratase n=1 Tax=Halalkalibacter suaedae TaxID=2822140 RepID=A0A941AQ82_9BACI|nr:CDP-glucose 4,6-dehydratase [Bacillus suaedae]MBP3950878.1 CDP-glucose 4,6-dehydratase [Bacillus suaedae]